MNCLLIHWLTEKFPRPIIEPVPKVSIEEIVNEDAGAVRCEQHRIGEDDEEDEKGEIALRLRDQWQQHQRNSVRQVANEKEHAHDYDHASEVLFGFSIVRANVGVDDERLARHVGIWLLGRRMTRLAIICFAS